MFLVASSHIQCLKIYTGPLTLYLACTLLCGFSINAHRVGGALHAGQRSVFNVQQLARPSEKILVICNV